MSISDKRSDDISELYRQGYSLDEIGKKFGLTRERVRQLRDISWKEEIDRGVADGFGVDIAAFFASKKAANKAAKIKRKYAALLELDRAGKLPETIRQYTSVEAFCKDYSVTMAAFCDMFPDPCGVLEAVKTEKRNRWTKNYTKCRFCGETAREHYKFGYCQPCYRDVYEFSGNRELAFVRAGQKCESCGMTRIENRKLKHQDLSVVHVGSKDNNELSNLRVLCYPCMVKMIRPYRRKLYEWSRKHEKCLRCGTQDIPHQSHGFCRNCAYKK